MGAYRDLADRQYRRRADDFAEALDLGVELPALRRLEGVERLDGEVEFAAAPALVPDAADDAVDE